ncbi:MAG TPA: DUF1761 family protein [Proteobacteria bacterium]|nr:DUF1761 family protein [Pseudomonadota bacterium]
MNIFTIIISTIVYVIIGAIWFNVFKSPYLVGLGKTAEELQQGASLTVAYISSIISGAVIAFFSFLGHFSYWRTVSDKRVAYWPVCLGRCSFNCSWANVYISSV